MEYSAAIVADSDKVVVQVVEREYLTALLDSEHRLAKRFYYTVQCQSTALDKISLQGNWHF